MSAPKLDQKISVLANQIAMYWDQITVGDLASGNSPITEYVLEENDGLGWKTIEDSLATTYIRANATPKKQY